MFDETQLSVIRYCAEECERQQSGPVSVYNMINAWDFAEGYYYGQELWWDDSDGPSSETYNKIVELRENRGGLPLPITLNFIAQIGHYCEPRKNQYKDETYRFFRKVPIFVGNGFDMVEKAPWERVPELLERLIESYYEGLLAPMEGYYVGTNEKSQTAEDEFYYQFENIHPFVDGNGRTGKILYNYLLGSLNNPVMPPNFWGSANP